jgi:tRNA nucleotidyltransferase (CCA-adding enzyme)
MADYIYLLQTRLTPAQQKALATVRDVARSRGLTVFLVGGAVRDLTSGSPIRDLDVVVQGSAPKLRKELEQAGGVAVGESDTFQSLFFHFPGGVRLEVASAVSVTYPKPGKPVAKPSTILDDLHHRDFTANAMAISLNEGSYGLLMDPLNGVADIENRELRLVSPYGFIEDPSRMIRAARFGARLGWHMEARTQTRYETGKAENYVAAMNEAQRGYETEEIIREEDPLRVLKRLESEGWMKNLFTAWTSAKANEADLNRLRDTVGQLNSMGIFPDPSAAYFPLMTAKLSPKEVTELKKTFARPGFAKQIESLEAEAKAFGVQFSAKDAAAPSAAWKLLGEAVPESILWLAHSTKSAPVQARFKAFFTDWPQARQKIPYTLMQEMRITPDLPGYDDLVEKIFFAIMDGKLDTPEAAKAFLEPFSPPAPPPPVNMRRRAVKRETKPAKPRSKKAAAAAVVEEEDTLEPAAQAPAPTPAVKTVKAAATPKATPPAKAAKVAPVKAAPAKAAPAKAAKKIAAPAKKPAVAAKAKPAAKAPARKAVKPVAKKAAPSKVAAKKAPAKVAAKKPTPVAKKAAPKVVAKKAASKPAPKKAVAKKAPAKPAPKKSAPAKKAAAPAKKSKPAAKPKKR